MAVSQAGSTDIARQQRASAGTDDPSHHPLTIFLHWSTLVLILLSAATVFGRDLIEDKAGRWWLLELHRNSGLLIFVLLFLRLVTRLAVAPVRHELPVVMRALAFFSHGAVYLILAGMPLLGWALSNARGTVVMLFGWLALPRLVATDLDLADTLADFHEWGAWVLYAVVALHVAAALWHHHVRKDQVLRAMLPRRG